MEYILAIITPDINPHKCASHEIKERLGKMPQIAPPYKKKVINDIIIVLKFLLNIPTEKRYPIMPYITPLEPTCTVPPRPISHVPSPPQIMICTIIKIVRFLSRLIRIIPRIYRLKLFAIR